MAEKRAEILVRIGEILHRVKLIDNTDQLDEQTGLFGRGIGLDSIEILQLVMGIEEEFELTIDDDELAPEHFRSIGNLITFIERRF